MTSAFIEFKLEDGSYCLPEGIYFNLPEDIYHKDKSLGSTGLKGISVDAFEKQFDDLHGEDKDTDALKFGSALHARILEGQDVFEEKFCTDFDKSKFEGALDTVEDITKWLDLHGYEFVGSKRKQDLIKKVHIIDPEQPVVEDLKKQWEENNKGKIALSKKRWAQIEAAARWVQRDPLLAPVMDNGTFIEGAPEVSIFCVQDGVRFKMRLDRMLRHAIVDLKSFAPKRRMKKLEFMAVQAIKDERYDLQAAAYMRLWHIAKDKYLNGDLPVFGDQPVPNFLKDAFSHDEPTWIWIFVKSTGAPQPLVIDWVATEAKRAATNQIDTAIQTFLELKEKFGADHEWVPSRPALRLDDETFRAPYLLG